ncbi:ATP-binding protein [Escherichia coli]|uniref:ATP-binding protein n=1 Tax=Enterobacteriaceae TaxID=543 RepID=UPI000DFCD45F|nr:MULTISPECIES: ATP-binding protein [Enterobacteriaceae]VTQ54512.1 predicted ATP-dependent endonuclease of the OLD family [Campylobacter jejuni]HDQ6462925.1 ATP-binding protein [Escherichia coli O18 str. F10018-41]EFL5745531.1 ATP-binding protein [Escherichia coli]QLK38747.1 AAA family ATPase [Citrobacter sp. 172116965]QMF29870.1 ATP-binding protein [Escherichia coli]
MKLEKLILKNFRGYHGEHSIDINSLTALVGRNDVGKTTILDALGVFFEHKLCKYDATDKCVDSVENEDVSIGCIFSGADIPIVLDATSITNLKEEYLLNSNGKLEIYRVFAKGKGSGSVQAKCMAPSAKGAKSLLAKKNDELKGIAESIGVDGADKRSNVSLRQEIYRKIGDLKLKEIFVKLNAEEGKVICEKIYDKLPHFALFRADRPSTDEESEVQDPMKSAVQTALQKIDIQLESIKESVKEHAVEVAENTIKHLHDISPNLAAGLIPKFKVEPKWENIFKLTLEDDRGIAINKRGSGVRRLVLISFFKAEAERLQKEFPDKGVIYAIEEPETSQHPSNQRLLIDAFQELANADKCQVLITTHVPALVEKIPTESLRHITRTLDDGLEVKNGNDDVLKNIANDLGVYPDSRASVLVCVEGPNDINFLKNIGKIYLDQGVPNVPDMINDPRIVFIPMGGHTLKDWVNNNYLKILNKPEIHIYDRDVAIPPQYEKECKSVNARNDGSIAFMTEKREMENYLHPDAIQAVFGVKITIDDTTDVSTEVSALTRYNESKAKKKINKFATAKMSYQMLTASDAKGETLTWFNAIYTKL